MRQRGFDRAEQRRRGRPLVAERRGDAVRDVLRSRGARAGSAAPGTPLSPLPIAAAAAAASARSPARTECTLWAISASDAASRSTDGLVQRAAQAAFGRRRGGEHAPRPRLRTASVPGGLAGVGVGRRPARARRRSRSAASCCPGLISTASRTSVDMAVEQRVVEPALEARAEQLPQLRPVAHALEDPLGAPHALRGEVDRERGRRRRRSRTRSTRCAARRGRGVGERRRVDEALRVGRRRCRARG